MAIMLRSAISDVGTKGRYTVEKGQTKQGVENLYFYLFERALHPELFHIDRVHRIEQRRYTAEIWIIGLAHAVTLTYNNQCFTELVAAESELLPKGGLVSSFRFRGERDHSQKFGESVHYMMSSQVERMTANLFPSSHRDLVAHSQKRGLFVSFPDSPGDVLAPFTYLDYEARDQEFHVHAYHAFSDELTRLKTQSIFEIDPPPVAST